MRNKKQIFLFFCLLFCFFLILTLAYHQEKISSQLSLDIQEKGINHTFTAWIFFTDKGPNLENKIRTTKESLSAQTLKRRLRHQNHYPIADEFDVDIYPEYISTIKNLLTRIRHQSRWLNAISVETTGNHLHLIARFPFVKKIDRVRQYKLPRRPKSSLKKAPVTTSKLTQQHQLDYGPSFAQLNTIQVPQIHDSGYSGKGVIICMLDSGFDNLNHEALQHLDITATRDFVNGDNNVADEPGQMGDGSHGTKTLGTIGGYKPGQLIGPAYGATYLLGKTENTEWERHIEEDHWIAGAEWADQMGADIISSSLGYRDQFSHNENDYAGKDLDGKTTIVSKGANIAASKGILVVNSAGNEGTAEPGENTLVSPADCEYVLAIGAVDAQGKRVSFSSMGPTADGRIKPDVMAMGINIYVPSSNNTHSYSFSAGTSFSCPLAAGVAALVLEANPNWTNFEVMEAIKSTANFAHIPDHYYGWGIINALESVNYQLKKVHPPRNFKVKRIENDLIFFVEYIDTLSWESNPINLIPIQFYRIYSTPQTGIQQTYTLVKELKNDNFNFWVRALKDSQTFIYKITAVTTSGEESEGNFAIY